MKERRGSKECRGWVFAKVTGRTRRGEGEGRKMWKEGEQGEVSEEQMRCGFCRTRAGPCFVLEGAIHAHWSTGADSRMVSPKRKMG